MCRPIKRREVVEVLGLQTAGRGEMGRIREVQELWDMLWIILIFGILGAGVRPIKREVKFLSMRKCDRQLAQLDS